MKASELHGKDETALIEEYRALLKVFFNLRMQHATQQLNNTASLKKVRRDIARVLTFMKIRNLQGVQE